jgi:hypothetical protein
MNDTGFGDAKRSTAKNELRHYVAERKFVQWTAAMPSSLNEFTTSTCAQTLPPQ